MSARSGPQEELLQRFLDAAARGDSAQVSSLLSNAPSLLNRAGPDGWTALMLASRNGHDHLAGALLRSGCDRSPQNRSCQTAFDIAKFWGHTHICRLLLRPDSAPVPALDPALDPGPGSGPVSAPGPGPVSAPGPWTWFREHTGHVTFFSAEPLDRLSAKRPDQDWIRDRQKDTRTVHLLSHKLNPLIQEDRPGHFRVVQFKYEQVQDLLERPETQLVFLGVDRTPEETRTSERDPSPEQTRTSERDPSLEQTRTSERDQSPDQSRTPNGTPGREPRAWFTLGSDLDQDELLKRSKDKTCFFPKNAHRDLLQLSDEEAGLVAHSRSVLAWHSRYSFCSTCGGRSRAEEAGHKRSCENTTCISHQGVHNTCYPRVDPVVIMLVLHPDQSHCLLGRKKVFPSGMFSCLAGFIEPGECVEAAVRREVQEESGVLVDTVWYVCSQPWPMPSSLMIGCLAVAVTTEITVDQDEIEEARWFSRQQVVEALLAGSQAAFVVPPRQTIAHQLLRHWTGPNSNL